MQQTSENIHSASRAASTSSHSHHPLAGPRRPLPRYSGYNDIQTLDIDDNGSIEVLDPYDTSISLQIQNQRKKSVHSVDELDGEGCLALASPIERSTRSSFEGRNEPLSSSTRPGRTSTESVTRSTGREETGWRRSSPSPPVNHGPLNGSSLFRQAVVRRGAMDGSLSDPDVAPTTPVFDAGGFGASLTVGPSPPHGLSSPRNFGTRPLLVSSRSVLSEVIRNSPFMNPKPLQQEDSNGTMGMSVDVNSVESFMQPNIVDLEEGPESLSSTLHSSRMMRARGKELPLRLYVATFLTVIVPQQLYLHLLLRLPYMYHSRVTQILLDANLTLEQMKELTLWDSVDGQPLKPVGDSNLLRAYSRLKKNWESFIDNVLREWKTLNIISGLLLSGILTIFQVDGTESDPITRYMAFWSLISALLSLMYGCFFIIRFSNMRRVYKATEWAIEAQKKQTMFWNVWVMLSMPAIWLVWSIIAYIACIMSFLWRVRPDEPNAIIFPVTGPATDFGFRIFICCVLGVGVLYAILIINTLRHYGSKMDRMWSRRIKGFRRKQQATVHPVEHQSPDVTRSPPIQFNPIIPPTPPQQFTQPKLSSSPPAPSSPPFAPPGSPSPRRFHTPSYPGEPRNHRYQEPQSPRTNFPIFSRSRQRLSPDPEKDSFLDARPDSPNSVDSDSSQPAQNGALGLFIPEEENQPSSPSPTSRVFDMDEPETRYHLEGDAESEPLEDTSSEDTGSTLILGQRGNSRTGVQRQIQD